MMQDLETTEQPAVDRLLRRREVEGLVSLSTSAIYRRMSLGTFPKPRDLGGGVVRWLQSDITAWVAELHTSEYRQPDQDAA